MKHRVKVSQYHLNTGARAARPPHSGISGGFAASPWGALLSGGILSPVEDKMGQGASRWFRAKGPLLGLRNQSFVWPRPSPPLCMAGVAGRKCQEGFGATVRASSGRDLSAPGWPGPR